TFLWCGICGSIPVELIKISVQAFKIALYGDFLLQEKSSLSSLEKVKKAVQNRLTGIVQL
ncbi:hypothetical protein, partial [Clostridium sp. HCS.1]|uniref:hypothetical protein n=1 Tax=Clostridium sp. HCS.1 TaxID=3238594 RepID=UPI003A0FC34E